MKPILIAAAALLLGATVASAQKGGDRSTSQPSSGMGSKTMESCRADVRKYCSTASSAMRKECLVKYWDRISNDCQDAVGSPGRGPAGATQ
jgi:hypothetical protein